MAGPSIPLVLLCSEGGPLGGRGSCVLFGFSLILISDSGVGEVE